MIFRSALINSVTKRAVKSSLLAGLLLLQLSGCTWSPQKRASILVIAVEGLSFDSFSCTSEQVQSLQGFSGLKYFCDEAVRFTHAYAPSALSQPTLASLMTGLYPIEHKVRNQGGDFLSGKIKTVAEVAVESGYRTNFISGGAPIWRKSGIGQGFEIFEDNISVNNGQTFRPIHRSAQLFLYNFRHKIRESSFFSVIYSNDLMFPHETTKNNSGEIRSQTVNSQLLEISETVSELVTSLKRMGRWDSTHVILVGLNGGLFTSRPGEERGYSLFSSNTQVKLFIKPATKKRDLGLQWTIDRNVSLVDVGATLFNLLGSEPPKVSQFSVNTLANVLSEPNVDWPEGRIIMTESAWPNWLGVGVERVSLRMDQYLLIYDQRPQLYNTLIDRQEVARIKKTDPLVKLPMERFSQFIEKNKISRWRPLPETLSEKLAIARNLWKNEPIKSPVEQRLRHISRKRSWDTQVWGWQARELLADSNWSELLRIGKESGNQSWQYLASQQLGQISNPIELKNCYKTLKNFEDVPSLRDCDDPVFVALAAWVREKESAKIIQLKENFLRLFKEFKIDSKIAEMNFHNGLTWSVSKRFPGGPSLTEIALALPRMESFQRQVQSRFSDKNL